MAEQNQQQPGEKAIRWPVVRLPNGNISGKLQIGVQVGKDVLTDYEIRPATVNDLFEAELIAAPQQRLTYQGALICRQMVRLGDIEGPLDLDLIRKLKPIDFYQLDWALDEVEAQGKPESSPSETGTKESSSSE